MSTPVIDGILAVHIATTNAVSEVIELVQQAETFKHRSNYITPDREPDMSVLNDFLDNLARLEGYYEDIAVEDSRGIDPLEPPC